MFGFYKDCLPPSVNSIVNCTITKVQKVHVLNSRHSIPDYPFSLQNNEARTKILFVLVI